MPDIVKVTSEDVKLPNQPIDDFAASTETLAVEADEDREALAAAGMDVNLIGGYSSLVVGPLQLAACGLKLSTAWHF